MADLTSVTTFHSPWVSGNRRVVYADLTGGSTADFIVAPMQRVDWADAVFRSSVVTASSVAPAISIDGTTVNFFRLAATTAAAIRIRIEGA